MEMNHEQRIKQLERQVEELFQLVDNSTWIPLSQVKNFYNLSPSVIRRRIHNGELKHKIDYRMNGNRYLINRKSIEEKII